MRGLRNDALRWLIARTIVFLGFIGSGVQKVRVLCFRRNQKRLRRKYGVAGETPVLPYGPALEQSIQRAAREGARFAETSGTTGKPKRILYTKRRLLTLKLTFSDMFARACCAFRIKRTSLYVFGSFEKDASLTSLLLDETTLPNYFATLQAPYRVQQHPSIQALVREYGTTAVRLWILTISNPGVLYSTNPSTMSIFLDEIAHDWRRVSKLVRDWRAGPATFDADVQRIARRLESRGTPDRLKEIATSDLALPLSVWAPAVQTYICWTGGYVQPFLDRLATSLPAPRYRLIPMYSMSTETIETLPSFHNDDVAFLPLAPGVLYEFMDDAENLYDAHRLKPGELYAMIVSDAYGLRRYQTNDLFLCKRMIDGLPDLRFVRRRSLEYSFTGEKLTAEQLSIVFDQLRFSYGALIADKFLTCVPAPQHNVPRYEVLLVGDCPSVTENSRQLLAARCDELLCEINCEYRSKRAGGRLGPIEVCEISLSDFLVRGNWESQFKFLPLAQIM